MAAVLLHRVALQLTQAAGQDHASVLFRGQGWQSIANGWPTSVRAVALEFPDDPTSWYLDREFIVGSQILAAPVFEEDGSVEYYLPPGRWFNFWDGEQVHGGVWTKETYGFLQCPLFVRSGTILVLGQADSDDGFGYPWLSSGGEVRLYGAKTGDKTALVDMNGNHKGILEVDSDGELEGMHILSGEWKVSKLGSDA